jgi:hypothetical protein
MSNLLEQVAEPHEEYTVRGPNDRIDVSAYSPKVIGRRHIRRPAVDHPTDPNLYIIPLTRGYTSIIDRAFYGKFGHLNWFAHIRQTKVYAATRRLDGHGLMLLQNLILPPPIGKMVDHINGDGLDNRLANLRIASTAENTKNTHRRRGPSGFIGVRILPNGTFNARIMEDGVLVHLAVSSTAEGAARIRDAAAIRVYGKFAVLNFPKE